MLLQELRAKQAQLLADARARLDEIKSDTPEGRAAELEAQHDAAMAEWDKLEARCARLQKLVDAEERARNVNADRRPNGEDRHGQEDRGGDEAIEYRHVLAKVICGVEVGELSADERKVLRAGATKFEQRIQTAGSTSAGGYTVPTELAGFIDQAMKDWGPMYDETVATVIKTSSGHSIKVPTVDDTAKSGGAHTEGTALTDDGSEDVVFGQKSLDAFGFDTEFVKWSWELDMDSVVQMEQFLGMLLGERLGRLANTQLTVGSGASAPNGIVTASSLGLTAASATAVTFDEILGLEHSVNAAYRRSPKARWMFADSTFLAIRKLKDGQGNYLWQQGDVKNGAPGLFNGRPYSINDDMPAIATGNKAILFGDFGRYYVRKVGAPIIGVVRERFWPDLGIAGLIRFDGELGQAGAVKHLKLA